MIALRVGLLGVTALAVCSGAAADAGAAKAPRATSTTLPASTTTTTRPVTTTTSGTTATSALTPTTVGSSPAPTSPVPTTPAPPGAPTTTTTAPRHVVNQPNIDTLVPHIEPLRGPGVQYQESDGVTSQAKAPGTPSFLDSPGGPYLYDSQGRVVLFHGVNVVYKHPPYIAYPDPGKPWDLSARDARQIRDLGFDVVRLGIEWQGLEPGSGGPNQPNICTPGDARGARANSTRPWRSGTSAT